MKLLLLLISFLVTKITCQVSTTVYIQTIGSAPSSIKPLAEIQYDPSTTTANIISYEAPDLSPDVKLVQLGISDPASHTWKSSTSVTSAESFSKGFAPIMILSLDSQGAIIGISCKSGKIDAGQTRDFGPKVKVVRMSKSSTPELNRPVVLSREGKVEVPEPEKTFLQKYWMIGLGVTVILLMSGGGEK